MKTIYEIITTDQILTADGPRNRACTSRAAAARMARELCANGNDYATVYVGDKAVIGYRRNPHSDGPRVYKAVV